MAGSFIFTPRPLFRTSDYDRAPRSAEEWNKPQVTRAQLNSAMPAVGAALAAGGGYERAHIPTAEEAERSSRRGVYSMSQLPQQSPFDNRLHENLELRERAEAHDQAVADQERREGRTKIRNLYLKDKRWSALFQALSEAGADRVQTGARAGWEQPGFYDTQAVFTNPALTQQLNAGESALMRQLQAQRSIK